MSQHFVRNKTVRLAYERRGAGPPVVLVQGLGQPGRMWLGLPGGLLKSGFTVVTPDNRGTGASDVPLPPYGMTELADDLAAVIDDLGLGPVLVVGISLGGMMAQRLAIRHPQLVGGLVLAATTCGLPHGRPPSFEALRLLVLSALSDSPIERAMIQRRLAHPRSLQRNPELFAPWAAELGSAPTPAMGFIGQLAAASFHSCGDELPRVDCPTEAITGDSDEIIPPENSRVIAQRIPGAALTVVEAAGHVFPLEHPAELPRAIARVQARIDAKGPATPSPG